MPKFKEMMARTPVEGAVLESVLAGVAGSAIAVIHAIREDAPFEGVVAEVSRIQDHMQVVKSALSLMAVTMLVDETSESDRPNGVARQ